MDYPKIAEVSASRVHELESQLTEAQEDRKNWERIALAAVQDFRECRAESERLRKSLHSIRVYFEDPAVVRNIACGALNYKGDNHED